MIRDSGTVKKIIEQVLPLIGSRTRRWETQFYLLLAIAMGVFIVGDHFLRGMIVARGENVDDQLLSLRLSSPAPSPDIVVIDIDERSLERVGRDYGRWPWTNAVLAEAVANIAETKPRAVLVNRIISEPDLRDPDGDRALDEVARSYPQLVFPFVRLPAVNDGASTLPAALIPGARRAGDGSSTTVAAVLPIFESLQRNMGAANLQSDADGVIRRYQYWLPAGDYELPSTAASVVRLAGGATAITDDRNVKLNWRNKRGDYARVSFAEIYEALRGGKTHDWSRYAGKIVIIGASAPGISTVKATPLSTLTEDNTILATAIDDALNDTGLRTTSPLVALALALVMLAALARAFLIGVDQDDINRVFAAGQTGLIIVTFFSVSYSNFIVDLTLPFTVGLAYFAVAKTYYGTQHSTERGFERFWDATLVREADQVLLILLRAKSIGHRPTVTRVRRLLEREVSWDAVLHVNRFIDGRTFLGEGLDDVELLLAFLPRGRSADELRSVELARTLGYEIQRIDIAGLDERQTRAVVWREVVATVFPVSDTSRAAPSRPGLGDDTET